MTIKFKILLKSQSLASQSRAAWSLVDTHLHSRRARWRATLGNNDVATDDDARQRPPYLSKPWARWELGT